MSLILIVALLGAGAPPAPAPSGDTRCAACHSTEGWAKVVFPHDRTEFPLLGKHASVPCADCHKGTVEQKLDRRCAGCHQDPHAGEFGRLCESCHEEQTFKDAMNAEAHRRTAFPLIGAHATIPCQECHQGSRERRFTRAASDCASCHLRDYARASLDHAAARFGTDCRRCHGPLDFRAARFAEHESCFPIASGAHAGIACQTCHSTLVGALLDGKCKTNTAACTSCHEHACDKTARQHTNVMGYRECKDRFCSDCHAPTR